MQTSPKLRPRLSRECAPGAGSLWSRAWQEGSISDGGQRDARPGHVETRNRGVSMEFWNNPRNRLLCAEPLEHRRLLSGAAPADAAEGDEDSGDREIETSDLPRQVIDALQVRFPDVELLEAELTDDDGDALYEVGAELD